MGLSRHVAGLIVRDNHAMLGESRYPLRPHFRRAVGERVGPRWPAPVLLHEVVLPEEALLVVRHLRLMDDGTLGALAFFEFSA